MNVHGRDRPTDTEHLVGEGLDYVSAYLLFLCGCASYWLGGQW